MSFFAIALCVASQRVFIVVVCLVMTQSGNFWIHHRILPYRSWNLGAEKMLLKSKCTLGWASNPLLLIIELLQTELVLSRMALGPTQPRIQWVPGALSLGVKLPGREADHSPPYSAYVKECVEL
jgi:hypothetical protein